MKNIYSWNFHFDSSITNHKSLIQTLVPTPASVCSWRFFGMIYMINKDCNFPSFFKLFQNLFNFFVSIHHKGFFLFSRFFFLVLVTLIKFKRLFSFLNCFLITFLHPFKTSVLVIVEYMYSIYYRIITLIITSITDHNIFFIIFFIIYS